jgi:hypothetical protein
MEDRERPEAGASAAEQTAEKSGTRSRMEKFLMAF